MERHSSKKATFIDFLTLNKNLINSGFFEKWPAINLNQNTFKTLAVRIVLDRIKNLAKIYNYHIPCNKPRGFY